MLEADLSTRFVLSDSSIVFHFAWRISMNALRKAFGKACALHTRLPPGILHRLNSYRVINTNVWIRGFADVPLAIESNLNDKRERKALPVFWDKDMDERLVAGIEKYTSKDWANVVNHMGQGLTVMQCKRRWYLHLKSKQNIQVIDRDWTENEVAHLCQRVNEYLQTPKRRIGWAAIAKEMNRTNGQCRMKWDKTQFKSLGVFTAQEDAYIRHAVDSAGGPVKGIWPKLAAKLGRQANRVRARYLLLKAGAQPKAPWSVEMDPFLVEARGKGKKADWRKVAALMVEQGWNVTSRECNHRWNNHLKHIHHGLRFNVEWTQAELDTLVEMRRERKSWGFIGKILNIVPKQCETKHDALSMTSLKRCPFNPEEDAIIIAQVAEWGDPKQKPGLWIKLQEKMHRPSSSIRHRWYYKLYHEQEQHQS